MTNEALKLLKLYSTRNTISLKELGVIYNNDPYDWSHPIAYLKDTGYLEILPSYIEMNGDAFHVDAPLRITYAGKTALDTEIKSRRHLNFNEIRAWITLAIALAAFILSLFNYAAML